MLTDSKFHRINRANKEKFEVTCHTGLTKFPIKPEPVSLYFRYDEEDETKLRPIYFNVSMTQAEAISIGKALLEYGSTKLE